MEQISYSHANYFYQMKEERKKKWEHCVDVSSPETGFLLKKKRNVVQEQKLLARFI